jgi:hypothetical protein
MVSEPICSVDRFHSRGAPPYGGASCLINDHVVEDGRVPTGETDPPHIRTFSFRPIPHQISTFRMKSLTPQAVTFKPQKSVLASIEEIAMRYAEKTEASDPPRKRPTGPGNATFIPGVTMNPRRVRLHAGPLRAPSTLRDKTTSREQCQTDGFSRKIPPFLIDSAARLEIAATPTKQRTDHISNRYSNSHFFADNAHTGERQLVVCPRENAVAARDGEMRRWSNSNV